jgi:hypothetical protein
MLNLLEVTHEPAAGSERSFSSIINRPSDFEE